MNKKGYNPFERGRWYKFFIESDNTNYTITTSDLCDATIDGDILKMPLNFHALLNVIDLNSVEGSGGEIVKDIVIFADSCQGIQLPNASAFDYATIHVFGYFN